MRLHWFSPLPPEKTDIAHYTARILPDLRTEIEVVLWVDQKEWDPALEDYATIRRYDPQQMPWTELNCDDVCIYHIGNNRSFHGPIWLVSRLHPGIVILHDWCLHHFFTGLYLEQWRDRNSYMALMELYYGLAGQRDAQIFCDGGFSIDYMAEHYPLTPLAIENALGVIVHTRKAFNQLKSANRLPVTHLSLPYAASSSATQNRLKPPPHSLEKDDLYRIVTFGYISSNRRLDLLLRALAEFPEKNRFHLDVYGQLWDSEYIQSLIKTYHLKELVQLHGFVPEAKLDHALSNAHLAVNLRYPSMGEASGSQLRIWDHSLPSMVTHVGWYADLPEDIVAFVYPGREIEDIQAHLRAFLNDPASFARMGENGRRVLEERHGPKLYAQAIVNAAMNAQRFRSHVVAYKLAQRVGAEISIWGSSTTYDWACKKTAEEIYSLICRSQESRLIRKGNRMIQSITGDSRPLSARVLGQ